MPGAVDERSPEVSEGSSSDWSDVEGDDYLANALASDAYLRGSATSASPGMPAHHPDTTNGYLETSTSADGSDKGRDTILIHHPLCELHNIPDHPERPGRVRAIMNALTRNFPGICTLLAPEAKVEQILRFHDRPHVDEILRLCSESERRGKAAAAAATTTRARSSQGTHGRGETWRAGIVRIDADTAVMPTSREAILRAAGAACFAVDEVMSGRAANAFCCVRPPGHHAEPDRAMGFCFFNNAPIGALHAQAEHGVERVAVVDIDVHHGNGTQAFFEEDPSTFYASTHQGPNFYPGTGFNNIKGVDSNVVNVNMEDGAGSAGFRRAYSEKVLPALEAFRPGLVVVSAGFDAHKDDPLAGVLLDEEDYRWVTQEICAVAARVCGGRVVSILEGGYNLKAISDSAVAHVHALREAAAATPSVKHSSIKRAAAAATPSGKHSSIKRAAADETCSDPGAAAGSDAAFGAASAVENGEGDDDGDMLTDLAGRLEADIRLREEPAATASTIAGAVDDETAPIAGGTETVVPPTLLPLSGRVGAGDEVMCVSSSRDGIGRREEEVAGGQGAGAAGVPAGGVEFDTGHVRGDGDGDDDGGPRALGDDDDPLAAGDATTEDIDMLLAQLSVEDGGRSKGVGGDEDERSGNAAPESSTEASRWP